MDNDEWQATMIDQDGREGHEVGRPHMPGYGLLAAAEGARLLDWDFVAERMKAARNYWVVTATSDGRPHAAPVWGLWHSSQFYFATGAKSRKARNLRQNPNLVVHLESGDEVVILEGPAQRVGDGELLAQLDRDYRAKYAVELEGSPVYRLQTKLAFAWTEANFPGSATRWKLDG